MTLLLTDGFYRTSAWQRDTPTAQRSPAGRVIMLLGDFEMSADGNQLRVPANVERLVFYLVINAVLRLRAKVARMLSMDVPESRAGARLRAALWQREETAPWRVHRDGCRLFLVPEVIVDPPPALVHARRITDDAQELTVNDVGFDDLMFDLLPHWDEEWLIVERERLRRLRVQALETRCVCWQSAVGSPRRFDACIAAVATGPLLERAHRTLITAHLPEGNTMAKRLAGGATTG